MFCLLLWVSSAGTWLFTFPPLFPNGFSLPWVTPKVTCTHVPTSAGDSGFQTQGEPTLPDEKKMEKINPTE